MGEERSQTTQAYAERDEVLPEGKWTFDSEVTDAFENMLERSIPEYTLMRQLVTDIAADRLGTEGVLVDLGASRGETIARIKEEQPRIKAHAVEVAPAMLEVMRKRWPQDGAMDHRVVVYDADLRHGLRTPTAHVTTSVLTLQFTPLEYRQGILRDIWRHTHLGGALILVEKVLGATADLDHLFVQRYLRLKAENGYSQEQIERKRLSLEGVLVPVTAAWNEDLLRQAGFAEVDCFWRCLNFAGWIAVRGRGN